VNGTWYFTTQTVTDSFTTSLGCDSIVITDLKIGNTILTYDTIYACKYYELNLKRYDESQEVILKYITDDGCDSIIYNQLYIMQPVTIEVNLVGCDSVVYNKTGYRQSIQFRDTAYGVGVSCDTIYNINVQVNNSFYEEHQIRRCYSVTVDGVIYTNSTTVVLNDKTIHGCDSINVYEIIISNPIYSSDSLYGCDSIVYNGLTYNINTMVVDTFISEQGCDSIHTAYIFITNPVIDHLNVTRCPGEIYELADGTMITESGIYTSSFTSNSGCDSIIIEEIIYHETQKPWVPDIEKCLGEEVHFDISVWNSFKNVSWSNGEENKDILLDMFGRYTVNLTDENDCIVRDTIEVIDANCPPCTIHIPNAFTPNGFGPNERFKPIHDCEFSMYKFQIYNRWGEKIFETFEPQESWDGVFMSKDVQQDAYVWMLQYVDKKTRKAGFLSGTVTLLR
jgi:gliding motility-associated-like protein